MANNQIKVAACQLLTSEDVSANTAKVLQQIEACAENWRFRLQRSPKDVCSATAAGPIIGNTSRHRFLKRLKLKLPKRRVGTGWLLSSDQHITMETTGTTTSPFSINKGPSNIVTAKPSSQGRSGVQTIAVNYRLWNSLALRVALSSATMSATQSWLNYPRRWARNSVSSARVKPDCCQSINSPPTAPCRSHVRPKTVSTC